MGSLHTHNILLLLYSNITHLGKFFNVRYKSISLSLTDYLLQWQTYIQVHNHSPMNYRTKHFHIFICIIPVQVSLCTLGQYSIRFLKRTTWSKYIFTILMEPNCSTKKHTISPAMVNLQIKTLSTFNFHAWVFSIMIIILSR